MATALAAFFGLEANCLNRRTALCLLAVADLPPDKAWADASAPEVGVTEVLEWINRNYLSPRLRYAPNTRETIRKDSIQRFVRAGVLLCNPGHPERPVNSPRTVYRLSDAALAVVRTTDSANQAAAKHAFLSSRTAQKAKPSRSFVPVRVARRVVRLSAGLHSELIRDVVEQFAPQFLPGAVPLYFGDTGSKWGFCDTQRLGGLGCHFDEHGKMPDVIFHVPDRHWLVVVEAVTSSGVVNEKRHEELQALFSRSSCGIVYVTAFPDRAAMRRYVCDIAWETEVWVAEAPAHMIHFNGDRFMGPHGRTEEAR